MIIYKATNLINNKIYIGKTVYTLKKRKRRHILDAVNKRNKMLIAAAIRKYGEENFTWETVDRCLFTESLIELEKYYIKKFDSMVPRGYNVTPGGDGGGYIPSEETKKKLSLQKFGNRWNIGKHRTEEEKEKMRKPHGPMSEETKRKLSEIGKRKVVSEETKNKIASSIKGLWAKRRKNVVA
jgi:group I intron endonuclease